MSETISVPRWAINGVIAPLIVALTLSAVVNGTGTYFGLKYLKTTVDQLSTTVNALPSQKDMTYVIKRVDQIGGHQREQDQRLENNHDDAVAARHIAASALQRAQRNQQLLDRLDTPCRDRQAIWRMPRHFHNRSTRVVYFEHRRISHR